MNIESLKTGQPKDFEKVIRYEMSPENSVDVDTELDWIFLEFVLNEKNKLNHK